MPTHVSTHLNEQQDIPTGIVDVDGLAIGHMDIQGVEVYSSLPGQWETIAVAAQALAQALRDRQTHTHPPQQEHP